MIAEADSQILQWTKEVLGESIAVLGPPANAQKGRGVGIHLLEVLPQPREHAAIRPRLQASLKYLVTSWATTQEEGHKLLGQLLEAAMLQSDYEVQAESLPSETWSAFGVYPQACLVLQARVWKELERKPAKLVRKLVLETVPGRPFRGVVVGPDEIPLSDADVEFLHLNLFTKTDPYGRFEFVNVPMQVGVRSLRVRARGQEMTIELKDEADEQSPVSIHFDLKE